MTIALDRKNRGRQIILNMRPTVSYVVNYGGQEDPYGDVHFTVGDNLIVGFDRGHVWRKRGGFGVTVEHLKSAVAYLHSIGIPGYSQFRSSKVGKP